MVVTDEPSLARGLLYTLLQAGYLVELQADCAKVLRRQSAGDIDLLLLDAAVPGQAACAICKQLRAAGFSLPVILLFPPDRADDGVSGLEVGADDCLTRPFRSRELLARIQAVLRRATAPPGQQLRFPHFTIDIPARQVVRQTGRVSLTAKEFELLLFLANNPGRVCSREQLLQEIWGYDYFGDSRTVDVHIYRLRDKLEPDSAHPIYLLTARGHGYYFERRRQSR